MAEWGEYQKRGKWDGWTTWWRSPGRSGPSRRKPQSEVEITFLGFVHPQRPTPPCVYLSVVLTPTQKTLVVTTSNLWIKLNFCPFRAIDTPLESSHQAPFNDAHVGGFCNSHWGDMEQKPLSL